MKSIKKTRLTGNSETVTFATKFMFYFSKTAIFMNDQITHYENKLTYEMDAFDLYEALEKDENVVVIDARKQHGYDKEHIAGAINFPHR